MKLTCHKNLNQFVTHTATFAKGNIRYGWIPPYYFFDEKGSHDCTPISINHWGGRNFKPSFPISSSLYS